MIVTVVISRTNTAFVYGPFRTKAHAETWALENLQGHTWQHSSVMVPNVPKDFYPDSFNREAE